MDKNIFEKKIQPVLLYVGAIGASIMVLAYILIVCVLIVGFKAHTSIQSMAFAIVNAIVGLIIMLFLKIQGISFAQNLPENRETVKTYFSTKTKDKKAHSISYFWLTSVIKDIITKGLSIAISTAGMIYIVIEGSNDMNMLLLAFVNLLMFVCFGFLALNNAYDFYNNQYIPYIKEKLEEK